MSALSDDIHWMEQKLYIGVSWSITGCGFRLALAVGSTLEEQQQRKLSLSFHRDCGVSRSLCNAKVAWGPIHERSQISVTRATSQTICDVDRTCDTTYSRNASQILRPKSLVRSLLRRRTRMSLAPIAMVLTL